MGIIDSDADIDVLFTDAGLGKDDPRERPRTVLLRPLEPTAMGGHRAGHACARACRCNRAKQSYLVIEIFVGASLLPTPDRMGEALRLTIGLDPP
jgi:hypothetical protein